MADYGELGYLLSQRQRPAAQGGQSLGFLLGGGGSAQRQQIFNHAALQGAQMQDVLAQARQRQQASIARDNLADEYDKRGEHELGQMIRASGQALNPSEIAKAREEALSTKIRQELYEHANDPGYDQNRQTRMLEILQGKPEQHAKVEGDTYFDPYRTPDSQTPQTTALGKARIAELGSLVAEHGAQAERARAGIGTDKAGNYELKDTPDGMVRVNKLTGETTPLTMNGQPVSKPPKQPKELNTEELSTVLGGAVDPVTNKATLDPTNFKRFLAKKAGMPGKSDTDVVAALQQDDAAAQDTGPSKDLAPPVPGMLSRMLGAGDGTSNAPVAPGWATNPNAPGLGDAVSAAGSGAGSVPADAVEFLKKNPHLRDQFDAKYGKGASAKVLGGG